MDSTNFVFLIIAVTFFTLAIHIMIKAENRKKPTEVIKSVLFVVIAFFILNYLQRMTASTTGGGYYSSGGL